MEFRLVNLSDLTDHPSPNYLLVLQTAQKEAIEADAGLLIVESDVIVKKNTLQSLYNGALQQKQCGIAAAVTTDEKGVTITPTYTPRDTRIKCTRKKSIAASAVHYSPPDC